MANKRERNMVVGWESSGFQGRSLTVAVRYAAAARYEVSAKCAVIV